MPVFQFVNSAVPYPSPSHVLNTLIQSSLVIIEHTHFQPNLFKANHYTPALRTISPPFHYPSPSRLHPVRALYICVEAEEALDLFDGDKCKVGIDSPEMQTSNEEALVDACYNSLVGLHKEDDKEKERRRKIGLANKGKVPWNKGKKHSAETRVRIKQRTIAALRDPKVRKRMAEHPRAHSAESKAKIGSSLRHIWARRLKWKRLGEKLFQSWSESIAKAAKDGSTDQKELDWDSYDKIKQALAIQQTHLAEEKEKAKKMAKIIAEKAAVERAAKAALAKAEKMKRLGERKKEKEKREKARRETKKNVCRRQGKVSTCRGLKLKQRLTKIHRKKSAIGPVSNGGSAVISRVPSLDGIDLSLIKKEKLQREVSLADQIKAAKKKRAEYMVKEVFAPMSCICTLSVRSEAELWITSSASK